MFSGRIDNCFDGHAHWAATGEMAQRLDLHVLKSPEDLGQIKIEPHHRIGGWLLGFGWDQNLWPGQQFPTRHTLDQIFDPHQPVCFSRADGHASWVNSEALRRAGLLTSTGAAPSQLTQPQGGRIQLDSAGVPTGILLDTAMAIVDQIIPAATGAEVRSHLLKGALIFNQAGFTHIRDLSCSSVQWQQACRLEDSGLLSLAVEQFFGTDDPSQFDKMLQLAQQAAKEQRTLLRVRGPKVYVDGALGSEGAWLSQPYASGSGTGLQLLTEAQLCEFLERTWHAGLELAVHVIGDEAAHFAMRAYHQVLARGPRGVMHLEHVELLRPETLALMKGQAVVCHLQPCHWLSDQRWLQKKIGPLADHAFQWRALQELGVAFDFGSDSPIEVPSIGRNLQALSESAVAGIPKYIGDPTRPHSHSDYAWVANCFSIFEQDKPVQVVFRGEHLF